MKILWLSHILPYPPKGGVVQRSYNLIKELSTTADIYLFAFNQRAWLSNENEISKAKNEFLKFCKNVFIFQLPSDASKWSWYSLVIKSFFSKNSYTVNWIKSNIMQREVAKCLANDHIDLIHCDTIGLDYYVKEIRNIPKVMNHHGVESQMMLRRAKKETNLLKKIYFFVEGVKLRKYESNICPNFDLNITVSELDLQRLSKINVNIRSMVIPNGVDINYFKPGSNDHYIKHNIIFAARMNAYPNEDAVVWFLKNIWPIIKTKTPNATFTIAGRNPTARLKKLIKKDSSIIVTGFVDDIRPLIQQAEVYVCPIRDGGGTKVKLLDAMAMGKAIVSTSIGAEGLEVENNQHLLIADDPLSFSDQISRLFADPTLRITLGFKARELVEAKYDWAVIGKKINEAYFSLVHDRNNSIYECKHKSNN